ncbi:light harvesting protein subunit alpha [Rhodococcus sp. IEGM 1379]|uniref:light harvesting protein subunit alpha n=1 Tax=Rhodococcus sp. IEGM 1379 TaxID=3047086 RepID=UPI0024B816CC|nr:light harvesting protein subunit alpha [Rhodococcus sp. IEGM 1379]MDI9918863.1 light harvesting protein subunit alpha [Rhodococcus sp. IEGM 1379]
MTRTTAKGTRARRIAVAAASIAVLGAAVVPGIAWASDPISESSPVVLSTGSVPGPVEAGVATTCSQVAPISGEELHKLIEEGQIAFDAEPAVVLAGDVSVVDMRTTPGGSVPAVEIGEAVSIGEAVPSGEAIAVLEASPGVAVTIACTVDE